MSYSLSIRAYAGGFSFLVHSVASGQVIIEEKVPSYAGESETENFRRLLAHPRLGGREYERIRFLSNAPVTQIPLDEFRREDIVAIYRQVFSDSVIRAEDLAVQILPHLEVVCIMRSSDYGGGYRGSVAFHAVVSDAELLIVAISRGRLLYTNTFACDNDADRLYFLMSVWRLLEMDEQYDQCNIYGEAPVFLKSVRDFIFSVRSNRLPPLINI